MLRTLLNPFVTVAGRPRRWVLWVVGIFAGYCLLFGLVLPYILRGVAETQISRALRADCTLERITYNPFTLTLGAHGLRIPYPGTQGAFFTLEKIELAPGFSTVLRLAPALGHLTIVRPAVDVTLFPDGSSSVARFFPEEYPATPGDASADSGVTVPFIVSNLEVQEGSFTLHDQVHGVTHTVTDLNVSVPFTSSLEKDRDRAMRPRLTAVINGNPVTLDGRTTPFDESRRTEFRLRFGQLPLDHFRPYLTPHTILSLDKGELTAETVLRFAKRGGATFMGLSGRIYLNDLIFSAPGEGPVLTLGYGMVDVDRVLLNRGHITISDVALENLMIRMAREKNGNVNWQRYMVPAPRETSGSDKGKDAASAEQAVRQPDGTAARTVAASLAQTGAATAFGGNATVSSGMNATTVAARNATNVPERNATAVSPVNGTGAPAQENAAVIPQSNGTVMPQGNGTLPAQGNRTATAQPPAAVEPAPTPRVTLRKLSLHNGRILWSDATVPGGFEQEFSPLNVEIRDVDTSDVGKGAFAVTLGEQSVAAPALNEAFFAATGIVPSVNGTVPAGNGTLPVSTGTLLSVNGTPPAVNGTRPVNASLSSINGTAPVNGENVLWEDNATSAVSMTPPPADNGMPRDIATSPVNGTSPSGNGTMRADTAASFVNGTVSADMPLATNGTDSLANGTIPAGNATASSGAGTPGVRSGGDIVPPTPPALVALASKPGGNIALRGTFTLVPLEARVRFLADAFPLGVGATYAKPAGVALQGGVLHADAWILAQQREGAFVVRFEKGDVSLNDLAVSLQGMSLRLRKLSLAEFAVDMKQQALTFGSLNIEEPQLRMELSAIQSGGARGGTAGPKDGAANTAGGGKKRGRAPSAVKSSAVKAPSVKPPAAEPAVVKPPAAEKPSASSGASTGKAPAWTVAIPKLRVSQGAVDLTAGPEASLAFSSLDCTVEDVSSQPGKPLKFTASGNWSKSGSFRIAGQGTVMPVNMRVAPVFTAIPLRPLAPWVRRFAVLDLAGGEFSCDLDVSAASAASGGVAATVTGKLGVDNLSLKEGGQDVFAFKQLRMTGLKADTAAAAYAVDSVRLDSPQVAFTLFADGMNTATRALDVSGEKARAARRAARKRGPSALEQAVKEQEKAAQQAAVAKESAPAKKGRAKRQPVVEGMSLALNTLVVQNGVVRFRDETLPRRAGLNLSKIDVRMNGLSSAPGAAATMKLTAMAEGAPLTIDAKINPLFTPFQGEGSAALKGMDLTGFSAYAEKFIAYPIQKGALSLDITVKLDGETIDAKNSIGLNKLTLGEKIQDPNAPDLPVKLGLSLLADSDGVIALDLPISGRLDDPELRTGGIVINAIGNVFFKILSSPFSLLGSLVGGGDDGSLQYIPFQPGDARIGAEAEKPLAALVDLLRQRPKVSLVLQGMADTGEKESLGAAVIRAGVQQIKWEDLSEEEQAKIRPADIKVGMDVDAGEYAKLLFDVYAGQPFDKPKILGITREQPVDVMEKAIIRATPATDAALEKIAQERAAVVKAEILRIDPSLAGRVSVAPIAKIREAASGAPSFARVEMGAQ